MPWQRPDRDADKPPKPTPAQRRNERAYGGDTSKKAPDMFCPTCRVWYPAAQNDRHLGH